MVQRGAIELIFQMEEKEEEERGRGGERGGRKRAEGKKLPTAAYATATLYKCMEICTNNALIMQSNLTANPYLPYQ